MMIDVQIAPAHPFSLRHRPQDRMRLQLILARPSREPLNAPPQPPQIPLHRRRPRAEPLGFALRHRAHSMRPLRRKPQPGPLQQRAREPRVPGRSPPLAHRDQQRIVQVANHLGNTHLAPPPLVRWANRAQPRQNLLCVIRIGQCLHASWPPFYQSQGIRTQLSVLPSSEMPTNPRIFSLSISSAQILPLYCLPFSGSTTVPSTQSSPSGWKLRMMTMPRMSWFLYSPEHLSHTSFGVRPGRTSVTRPNSFPSCRYVSTLPPGLPSLFTTCQCPTAFCSFGESCCAPNPATETTTTAHAQRQKDRTVFKSITSPRDYSAGANRL